jgi:hypothetical protein
MKIEEIKPTAREFQLTLSEDQLRVIEHALYVHDGAAATSGSVTAYSVWDKIDVRPGRVSRPEHPRFEVTDFTEGAVA